MPLDAICLRALTNELKGQLLDARIDKVQQPARDQIVLLLARQSAPAYQRGAEPAARAAHGGPA